MSYFSDRPQYAGLDDDQKHNRFYAVQQLAREFERQMSLITRLEAMQLAERAYDAGERAQLQIM